MNMSRDGIQSTPGGADSLNQRNTSLTTFENAYDDAMGKAKKKATEHQAKKERPYSEKEVVKTINIKHLIDD